MNITIIYENSKKNNIYNHINFLINNLKVNTHINVSEYFIHSKFSPQCKCFQKCVIDTCDYFNFCKLKKIEKSINDSDLVILACSNKFLPKSYKLIMDHLSCIWMPHKNNIQMFNKIGLIISNNSNPFFSSIVHTLKNHFKFWGIKNIFNFISHDYNKLIPDTNLLSKDYINLLSISTKIMDIYSSNLNASLESGKIINFSDSYFTRKSKHFHSKSNQNNENSNVIFLK